MAGKLFVGSLVAEMIGIGLGMEERSLLNVKKRCIGRFCNAVGARCAGRGSRLAGEGDGDLRHE